MNGILPIGHPTSKDRSLSNDVCKRCNCHPEPTGIMLQCYIASDQGIKLRSSVSGELTSEGCAPLVSKIVTDFMFGMRSDKSVPVHTVTDKEAEKAVKDCHLLTSIELWRCRVPKSIKLQQFFSPGKKNWGKVLVKIICNAFLTIWADRNDHHHGRTTETTTPKINQHDHTAVYWLSQLPSSRLPDMPGIPKIFPDPLTTSKYIINCFLSWAEPFAFQVPNCRGI